MEALLGFIVVLFCLGLGMFFEGILLYVYSKIKKEE